MSLGIEAYEAILAKERQRDAVRRGNVTRHESPVVANLPQLVDEPAKPQGKQNESRERAERGLEAHQTQQGLQWGRRSSWRGGMSTSEGRAVIVRALLQTLQ